MTKEQTDRSTQREGLDGVITERAMMAGQKIARQVFDKRGNHAEAHISEVELGALLALAFELGRKECT